MFFSFAAVSVVSAFFFLGCKDVCYEGAKAVGLWALLAIGEHRG